MLRNKRYITVICLTITLAFSMFLSGCMGKPAALTPPEITGGARGEMGIDRNINEETIDDYLGRDDVVYRDMRMLEDPAHYENIGGDRFLSGYIEGFEVVPLPYIIQVDGLPGAVGETYKGDSLFAYNDDYIMAPVYEESMDILEELFPKDKVIFLMCGGGGYASMMKDFLISMGWDPQKIYNVGGYWFYNGEHNIEVKKEENGKVTYDFESVPYHDIDFSKLTKTKEKIPDDIKLTGIVLNGHKVELEEDTSFRLKAIFVPLYAADQTCDWSTSDESTVYVDSMGLIRGLKPGTATITVTSDDGGFTDSCEVTVKEKDTKDPVTLSDVTEEAETFKSNDPNAIMREFDSISEDIEKAVEDGYYAPEGEGYVVTDLWNKEYDRVSKEAEKASAVRTEVLNSLLDKKSSFILVTYSNDCITRDYQAAENAEKILSDKGIPFFYISDMTSGYDNSVYKSKLNYDMVSRSAVTIFKDGEIYASLDPDAYSLKSDEELISWLSKYVEME